MRRRTAKFISFLLALGILFMLCLSVVRNADLHELESMQQLEPADIAVSSMPPTISLNEIRDQRQIKVSIDGKTVPMGLEDYIYCVVAAEMPASFELEALKAQAVAARTYTIRNVMYGGCSNHPGADVCDKSNHCQAFRSDDELKSSWKGKYAEYSAKIRRAVQETDREILTYDDAPILTLYHASSAGYTESVENVYSQALPYLRSVSSPDEQGDTSIESREEYDRADFCKTINAAYPKARLSASTLENQVNVLSRFTSGRVESIRLGGATLSGTQFRKLIDVRSTNFTVSYSKYSIIFTAEGFGHGVGMSQVGAQVMAQEHETYQNILAHYYTGTKLTKIS